MNTINRGHQSTGTIEKSDRAGMLQNCEGVMEALARDGVAKLGTVLKTEEIKRILGWLNAREAEGDELVKDLEPNFDVAPDGRRRLGAR